MQPVYQNYGNQQLRAVNHKAWGRLQLTSNCINLASGAEAELSNFNALTKRQMF